MLQPRLTSHQQSSAAVATPPTGHRIDGPLPAVMFVERGDLALDLTVVMIDHRRGVLRVRSQERVPVRAQVWMPNRRLARAILTATLMDVPFECRDDGTLLLIDLPPGGAADVRFRAARLDEV